MDEQLSPEQSQLRESAARLCRDLAGAKRARRLRDRGQERDVEAWLAMREAGWFATLVPEERGGAGLGASELYVLMEQVGRQVAIVPLVEAAAAAWALARASGGGADATLRSVLAGEQLVVPGLAGDGWDFRKAAGFAGRAKGNALAVSGAVDGVAFAPSADAFLIAVGTEGEDMLFLLPRAHPGVDIAVGRGVDGSTSASLRLADAILSDASIIARGEQAAILTAGMRDLLTLGTAVELLGLAESAASLTLEHIKTRQQFGHPLGSFQALQHRVVDDFVALELDRSLLHRIAQSWDSGSAVPAMIAAAKARVSRSAAEIMRTALQLHGAIGYSDEHDIGIFFKHALVLAARYGNEFTQTEHFARLTASEA